MQLKSTCCKGVLPEVHAVANAVCLSIRAEIPSGPVDLVVSKVESSLMMSSSKHSRATGHSSGGTGSTSSSDKGVTEILKFNQRSYLEDLL